MKTNKLFIYLLLIFISTLFYNCESWFTLDDDEVVIYEGKIFEAFNKSKEI